MASKAPAQPQQSQQPGGLPNAQTREPIKKERGKAMVKAVTSGDTVVLLITPPNAPPSEKQLTFSHVSAPRLAGKETKDEPFAWDSREYLRKKLIGKQVTFTVENKATNREYGHVYLNEEDVAKTVVSEGWAKAIAPPGAKEARGEHAELIQLSEAAQAAKIGIWTADKAAQERSIRNLVQKFDQLEIYERLKGKTLDVLIEQVRTGSTFRVLVTDEDKKGRNTYNLLIRLAGAQSPNIPFSSNKDEEPQTEPFAKEAKLFSEVRLLHRIVQLNLKGLDHKGDSFTAKISYAGKNVAEELIKAGFATFVEWNAPREDVDLLRATEGGAKAQGLRIWQFASSKSSSSSTQARQQSGATSSSNPKELIGKVRDITTYGAIAVSEASTGVKRVVNFSSINLPRIGGLGREDEPYAWEAREFLRSKLIGKRIKATLDYERQLPNATDLRGFYTVYLEKNNISILLVEKGYAKVVPHKNDEKRSSSYEALVINERKCQKKGKGVHGKPENAPIHRVNDLTAPAGEAKKANEKEGAPAQKKAPDAKVKQFLPFLKRAGRTPAIVEYVVHAGKFKCFVPKESCIINFVLTGVKVPQRRADASEPFADEALEFVRKKCHQRDVEIEVETQDKGGNFIGNMWVGRKLFAVSILEEGLASVNAGSASHSGYSADLFGAEDRAKRAKKNIWKNYDESQGQPKQETETEELKPRKEYLSVVVTEVLDGSNFFVNVKSDDLTQLELLMEKAQEWANQMAPGYVPAPNDKVLAQFPADNKWYRGRLIGKSAGDQYKVSFVDFGNVDVLPASHLRPLRDPALLGIPPQAKECFLAFIKPPALDEDYGRDAADHFSDLTTGKTMWANVEYRDREGRLYLSLGDPQSQVHVNAAMVHEGLARVEKRSEKHLSQLLQKLREEEEKARKAHLNIWQYGDVADEDEDEHYDVRRLARKK